MVLIQFVANLRQRFICRTEFALQLAEMTFKFEGTEFVKWTKFRAVACQMQQSVHIIRHLIHAVYGAEVLNCDIVFQE